MSGDVGYCSRCGAPLDPATPPSSVWCWECELDEDEREDDLQ